VREITVAEASSYVSYDIEASTKTLLCYGRLLPVS
jgi:hypothetical protein